MRTLQMDSPPSKRQKFGNLHASNVPNVPKVHNIPNVPKVPNPIKLSIRIPKFNLPEGLKEDIEYTSEEKYDPPFYIKEVSHIHTLSAIILKELQKKADVDHYLPPLLTQKIRVNKVDYSIIQTFPYLGNDLLQIGAEEYNKNRKIIHTTLDEAINFLHTSNVIHCDIKPENIIWDPIAKRSKLIDLDSLAYRDPSLMFESSTITRKDPSPLDYDLDNYAGEVTKQALDIVYLGKEIALEKLKSIKPGEELNRKAFMWIRKQGGMRSTRLTKRRRSKKNGRLRASQSRRRNYTRHVARQL